MPLIHSFLVIVFAKKNIIICLLLHIFEKCNLCEPSVQFLSFFVFIIIFVLKWVIPMSLIYSSLGNFIIFICLNFISFPFFFKVNTKATKSFLLRNSFFLKFHHYMIILAYYRKAQFLWRPYVVFVSFFFWFSFFLKCNTNATNAFFLRELYYFHFFLEA